MKKVIPMILFNVFEMICTILFGILLGTKPLTIAIIMLTWVILRLFTKSPMHYKSPVKCFFMTIFLFISIFLATKVDLYLGILMVIFDGVILSKYGNIKELAEDVNQNMFQWNNLGDKRKSKYDDLIELIAKDRNNPIILKYEKYWKENYSFRYEVFDMFYCKRMTYQQICSKKKLKDHTKIKNECKIIYSTLELPLNLKSLK